jgi:diguanylate cyclase (GGDEF)-like protein
MNEQKATPEFRATSLELQTQLDLISEALDASADGLAIWRSVRADDGSIQDFILLLMNKAGAAAAGQPHQNLIGRTLLEVVGAETALGLKRLFSRSLDEGHGVKEVVPGLNAENVHGFYENTVVPFGRDLVFATYRDVSTEEREHTRLLWLSEHDYLTGMPNRAKLERALANSVSQAKERQSALAFVFIDIDYFKVVNDTYGHEIGDALLVNFVKRIRNSLPDSSLVARIAGDEFAILIENVKDEHHISDLMEEVFSSMKRPFTHNEVELAITCSAGCAVADGTQHPDEIVRVADRTMYQAKNEGRNRYLVVTLPRSI